MTSVKAICLRSLVLAFLAGAPGLYAAAQDNGTMQGMKHENSPDMQTIHRIFAETGKIKRTVKQTPNGVETLTESSDPKVAAMLQEHAQAMHSRLNKRQPIRAWDPLFAEIFKHADKIKLEVTNTKRGVRITETSGDPYTVKILHAHANAVSGFIKDGMAGMAKRHEAPGVVVTRSKSKFLGKGDGASTCPVTGEPVDKSMKAVINGRTIYFCCASCIAVVEKNPKLYLKAMAQ
jgi:YHS domain-containing protein